MSHRDQDRRVSNISPVDPAVESAWEAGYPGPEPERDIASPLPPGDGKLLAPHYLTFSQLVNYVSRTYRHTHDEALRHSHANALAARRDPVVMEALRARQMPTAQLAWHLEVEDDTDQRQVDLADKLTKIINDIPDFQRLKMQLLEALWFGRYAVQWAGAWDYAQGERRLIVRTHEPVNGDKLVFRFSGQAGVLVHATYQGDWQVTDRGRAHFFSPDEREQVIVHHHEPEDADFFEPELGGGRFGVGIRSRIYWIWWLKSQVLAYLMDYLERVGAGGFTIYYYESGNAASLTEVQDAAEKQLRNNVILFPRYRDGTTGGPGVERIEVGQAGAALLENLITNYFDAIIRRYILGQELSSQAGPTGLGSGLADLHADTFARIIKYDAVALEETLTRDLVAVLAKYTAPGVPPPKFRFEVEKPNASALLEAARAFYEMGGQIDEDELRSILGLAKPEPGHAVLSKLPNVSPAGIGAMPMGIPMAGQPGPEGGEPGQSGPGAPGLPAPDASGPAEAGSAPWLFFREGTRLRLAAVGGVGAPRKPASGIDLSHLNVKGESASERESREARETFDRGGMGFHDMLRAQPVGTKAEHEGRQWINSMDGLFYLEPSFPLAAITHRPQEYRNDQIVGGYRQRLRLREDGTRGSIEPISLRPHEGGHFLWDGHHRVDAAEAEGLTHLPAWVQHAPEQEPLVEPERLRAVERPVRFDVQGRDLAAGAAKPQLPADPQPVPEPVETHAGWHADLVKQLEQSPNEDHRRALTHDLANRLGVDLKYGPVARRKGHFLKLESAAQLFHALSQEKLHDEGLVEGMHAEDRDALQYARLLHGLRSEAEYQLTKGTLSGKDWYGPEVEKTEAGLIHLIENDARLAPLKGTFGTLDKDGRPVYDPRDPQQHARMTLWKMALVPLSYGNRAVPNVKFGVEALERAAKVNPDSPFEALPAKRPGWTGRFAAIKGGFARIARLVKERGEVGAAEWLTSQHPAEELRRVKPNVDLPFGNDKDYYGSYVFGPKGGPFAANLAGVEDELTPDMWWSRTFYRHLGKLVSGQTKGQVDLSDAPRNRADRRQMKQAAQETASQLGLSVRDFQAIMWYYEKQAFAAVGAAAESESYSDGIANVLQQRNLEAPEFRSREPAADLSAAGGPSEGPPRAGPDADPGRGDAGPASRRPEARSTAQEAAQERRPKGQVSRPPRDEIAREIRVRIKSYPWLRSYLSRTGERVRLASQPDVASVGPEPEPPSEPDPTGEIGSGAIFASPSVEEGGTFEQAYSRLRSSNQAASRKIAEDVYQAAGLTDYQMHDAVGDWSDGAEPSFLSKINGDTDYDTIRYTAAWQGLLNNQKSVLVFRADDQGPDSVYQVHVPEVPASDLRKSLDRLGIQYRTLVPVDGGHVVVFYDEGRKLQQQVQQFAEDHDASIREAAGSGDFIGGSTRTAARAAYRRLIRAYESGERSRPTGRTRPADAGAVPSGEGASTAPVRAGPTGRPSQPGSLYQQARAVVDERPLRLAAAKAPPGGMVVRGVYYEGGKFLPTSMMNAQPTKQKYAADPQPPRAAGPYRDRAPARYAVGDQPPRAAGPYSGPPQVSFRWLHDHQNPNSHGVEFLLEQHPIHAPSGPRSLGEWHAADIVRWPEDLGSRSDEQWAEDWQLHPDLVHAIKSAGSVASDWIKENHPAFAARWEAGPRAGSHDPAPTAQRFTDDEE